MERSRMALCKKMELHVYHEFFVGISMICLISAEKHRLCAYIRTASQRLFK